MTPLGEFLKDGDPLATEPMLGYDDVRAIRRTVVAAADDPVRVGAWRHAAMVTAMAALMLAAIATVARRAPQSSAPGLAGGAPPAMDFLTPGGTRVIWQFPQSTGRAE